jgi:hypothetical protein
MFYICECTQNCGGYVGFWRCADKATIIVRCDECEAPWREPADVTAQSPLAVEGPNYVISGTDIPIFGPDSGWASEDEIRKAGWFEFVKRQGKALGDP